MICYYFFFFYFKVYNILNPTLNALISVISQFKSDNVRVLVSNTDDFYSFQFYKSVTNSKQIKSVEKINSLKIDYFTRFNQFSADLILIKCTVENLFTFSNYLNVNNLPDIVWIPEP